MRAASSSSFSSAARHSPADDDLAPRVQLAIGCLSRGFELGEARGELFLLDFQIGDTVSNGLAHRKSEAGLGGG
jgi:hypothetical protein